MISACSNPYRSNKKHGNSIGSIQSDILGVNLKSLQSLDTMASKLAQHRVVFVGESHTNYGDHLNQLAIIKQLHKRWGKALSIGLEMIQQPFQKYLDQYITGDINEAQMLRGTEWYDRWKYEFRLYRPIFDYAKQNRIPLVALNIPKELTKKITKVGIDGLSKEERTYLPKFIDRSNKAYVKRITDVFSGHSHTSSKGIKKFLDAQLGWDEGMAFAAAKYLKQHPIKRMVIVAGGGHVINYEGIPDRLDRQLKTNSAVILNNSDGNSNANSGDYLLFSAENKLPSLGRFGIGMGPAKENSAGVMVTMVAEKSAAKKAGIQKGDLVVKLNNQRISDITDFKIFTEKTKPGSEIKIVVKRKSHLLSLQIKLMKRLPNLSFFREK